VPDDVVLFGRESPSHADLVRELFGECYRRQVLAAFAVTDDWAHAEQIVIEAFSRLRRRIPTLRDPAAALAYLDRAVAELSGAAGRQLLRSRRRALRPASPARTAPPPHVPPPARLGDVERAWTEIERRALEASRMRRRWLSGCAAVAAAGAALAAGIVAGPRGGGQPGPAAYPSAVVARVPVPAADAMAADRGRLWVVTGSQDLVGIDTATSTVTLREPVPSGGAATSPGAAQLAAGDGSLWIAVNTTEAARLSTQLLRISPTDGRVLARIDLGGCVSQNSVSNGPVITYGAGRLWVGCLVTGSAGYVAAILRVNPATDRVDGRTGLVGSPVTVGGALWTLADGSISESLAGGQLSRMVVGRSADPGQAVTAGDFAVSGQSLWLVGPPITRVSVASGRVLAQITAPWERACCGLIAATPGAIWVSTGSAIVRLDPARIPPGPAAG
jgi:hypothetical protein